VVDAGVTESERRPDDGAGEGSGHATGSDDTSGTGILRMEDTRMNYGG
jgi:hypothetical protein